MAEWGFLSDLFETLQVHSTMLGRFWLLLMLVFRMLILGTVASDMFEDEQEEFACNTLQPGCKQVCYDEAFPISQYRFWVFHIVLISTPSMVFVMYAVHHNKKKLEGRCQDSASCFQEERQMRRLYIVNVGFRLLAELAFVVAQWWLYGFRVEAQFPCSRFPCPYTVDCFTSRPMEKTVFLCFYFAVGVISTLASFAEMLHITCKWFSVREPRYSSQNKNNLAQEEALALKGSGRTSPRDSRSSGNRHKFVSVRSTSSGKFSSIGRKNSKTKSLNSSIAV
ncbi:gap junction delta-3 protein-like [Conger conger]|uniref:gap junction delta-3 protein-like n=1 Tax=Conger conger TaxID=82655 RepID=UPI002A59DF28|nr:gap junction delta-3 protein-like [Conger conger]